MSELTGITAGGTGKQAGNSAGNSAEPRIYVYNLDDNKTPGRLKVRVKIRVVTGDQAARLDARQAAAIMELIRCRPQPQPRPRSGQEPP